MKTQIKLPHCSRKWFIWSRVLSVMLVLCMTTGIIPVSAQKATRPILYKVEIATENHFGTPYCATINGDIIGEMPKWQVYEAVAIEGDWVKVKYKGGEYYIWKGRLKQVDAPDMVCSPWAKDWLSHTGVYIGTAGEWSGVADDWTKPITRADMADILVGIMRRIYGDWSVSKTLPGVTKSTGKSFFTDTDDFDARRLAYWGIVPTGKFNPSGSVTYDEFTAHLIKLMAYEKKYIRQGSGQTFTKTHITGFVIGGDKGPKAKCTKEQAKVLSDKVFLWRTEMEFLMRARLEKSEANSGTVDVYNGVYTIRTLLGTTPYQPHLIVNAEGNVELNSTKTQQFKITYKKCALNKDGNVMFLYTMQTMDGKYLGISGTPMNGSRLIAQKEEYLWWIEHGPSEDYQWTNFIVDPVNDHQVVNAAAWQTADGTPIITWFWKHGTGADSNNCKFIFSKVK